MGSGGGFGLNSMGAPPWGPGVQGRGRMKKGRQTGHIYPALLECPCSFLPVGVTLVFFLALVLRKKEEGAIQLQEAAVTNQQLGALRVRHSTSWVWSTSSGESAVL